MRGREKRTGVGLIYMGGLLMQSKKSREIPTDFVNDRDNKPSVELAV